MEALTATGLLFDIIEETVEHAFEDSDDWPASVNFALIPRAKDQEQYPGRSNRIDALWRTLIIDEDEHDIGKRASSEDGAGFESSAVTSDWEWLETWSNKHLARNEKRKLFWMKRGCLSISCRHVQSGDKVCILWGGCLPFELRERGRVVLHTKEDETARETMSHVLIGGECYVQWFGRWARRGHCPEGRSRYRKDLYCLVSKMMLGNDPKTTVRFRFRVSSRT
jgi:hypothetical protein